MTDTAAAGGGRKARVDEDDSVDGSPKKQPRMEGFDGSFNSIDSDLSSHLKDKLFVSFGSNDHLDEDDSFLTAEQLYENLKDAARHDEGDDTIMSNSFGNASNETSTSTLASSVASIHPDPCAMTALASPVASIHPHQDQIVIKHPIIYAQIPFLCRLRIALMQPDIAHIFCWAQDGLTFLVVDREAFRRRVLPEFFTQATIPAFRKQLNRYHFDRVSSMELVKYVRDTFQVTDFIAWSHPFFLRYDNSLESLIRPES